MINFTAPKTLLLKKPNPQEFIRTLDTESDILVKCVFDNSSHQAYIVIPELWESLAPDVTVFQLYHYVTRNGQQALWPIKAVLQTSRRDTWIMSAHQVANNALSNWLRAIPNQSKRRYESIVASGTASFNSSAYELTNQQIFDQINDDLIIRSLSHPLAKKLRGTGL